MRIAALSIITSLMLVFSVSAAIAQQPSTRGYDADSQVLGEIDQVDVPEQPAQETAPQEASVTPPVEASEGSLPFTGLEVGVVVLMGVALLGTGIVVRRLSHRGDVA
jgi:hypothetical protein